ncbi:MAG TPA: hypothetical protein VES95_07320 [Dermatophilaceae bacterium]|nr:hypothetical protein [Dermatophilaceae bacterium]
MHEALATLALLGGTIYAQYVGLRWVATGQAPAAVRPLVSAADRAVDRRRRRPEALPPVLLGLELRRLAAHIQRVEGSDLPHKAARLAAGRAAYDAVLLDYCERVDLPVPESRVPLSGGERFQAEEALISAGHGW